MADLLPCPFCGGENVAYDNDTGPNDDSFWSWIGCNDCGAKADDAESWNRRAPAPQGEAPPSSAAPLREALEKAAWACKLGAELLELAGLDSQDRIAAHARMFEAYCQGIAALSKSEGSQS